MNHLRDVKLKNLAKALDKKKITYKKAAQMLYMASETFSGKMHGNSDFSIYDALTLIDILGADEKDMRTLFAMED